MQPPGHGKCVSELEGSSGASLKSYRAGAQAPVRFGSGWLSGPSGLGHVGVHTPRQKENNCANLRSPPSTT